MNLAVNIAAVHVQALNTVINGKIKFLGTIGITYGDIKSPVQFFFGKQGITFPGKITMIIFGTFIHFEFDAHPAKILTVGDCVTQDGEIPIPTVLIKLYQ